MDATTWVRKHAPSVPKGKPAPSLCRSVLRCLADHGDRDGRNCCPSTTTIAAETDISERTVRYCLDRLQECGIIRPADPAIIAKRIPRADRRPQGFDLATELRRNTNGVHTVQAVKHEKPAPEDPLTEHNGVHTMHPDEGHTVHPVETPRPAPSAPRNGANGVHVVQLRGARGAPDLKDDRRTPYGSTNDGDARTRATHTRAPARETPRKLQAINGTARKPETRKLINHWRDEVDPDRQFTDQFVADVTAEADTLIRNGHEIHHVRRAVDLFVNHPKIWSPKNIPKFIDQAVMETLNTNTQPEQSPSAHKAAGGYRPYQSPKDPNAFEGSL